MKLSIAVAVFLIVNLSLFAHSGRTDKNGGHWDRKNGTYHYHTIEQQDDLVQLEAETEESARNKPVKSGEKAQSI